jgi:osmotically-inducible protein OsmY
VSIQDEALSARVREVLARDKRTGGQAIAVRVAQGEVFLKGIADTEEQKNLAEVVVRGIAGVRYVNADELGVREGSQ